MSDDASGHGELAVVMTGGGARAAYQVGFLRGVAAVLPDLRVDILTGVSAGAINAVWLAAGEGSFRDRIDGLAKVWDELRPEDVMNTHTASLFLRGLRSVLRLASGGRYRPDTLRGLIGTDPLRAFLRGVLHTEGDAIPGIRRNIEKGNLQALAITSTSYSTGQTITFCQGRDVVDWERPKRRSQVAEIGIEHVMASSSLPILFPAVQLAEGWHGDGGIRLTSPLAPAVHLGAKRVFAVSTRFGRSQSEAAVPMIDSYPPPAQIAGILLSAIFLDLLDEDALRLQRTNRLLADVPPEKRGPLRVIDFQIWRPSVDLGRLANLFEARLPKGLRFAARGTGTLETRSNDFLSLIMFQNDYLSHLLELGERDATAHLEEIVAFLDPDGRARS